MNNPFTYIDSNSISKEVELVDSEIRVLQRKRAALMALLSISSGDAGGLVDGGNQSTTLKGKVIEVLLRGETPIGDIAKITHPDHKTKSDAPKAKAAIYTVFNRNKDLFKNVGGKWALTEQGKLAALS